MEKIYLEILDMIKDTIRYLGYIVFVVISGSLVLLSFASHKPLLISYTVLVAVLELFCPTYRIRIRQIANIKRCMAKHCR